MSYFKNIHLQSYGFGSLQMKGDSPAGVESRSNIVARLWRLFWLLVLVGHALAAVFWCWLEPGGFGFEHPRFWVNRVAPVGGLCLTITALLALGIQSTGALRWLLPLCPRLGPRRLSPAGFSSQ
jgi:hypothetical protein